jgi:type VI protein secretion system component VasK
MFGYTPNNKAEKTTGFSEFFTNTGSAEKKKIIEQAVKKANNDQKELIEKYDRKFRSA